MNISNLYDKSIKLIDESYLRLQKIWALPKGSVSKKTINNRNYYYHQYRDGKKIVTRILNKEELETLRKEVNERKRLVKLNKSAKNTVNKNIKVIAIFDKGLSASLMDEAFAYSFDEIPVNERSRMLTPLVKVFGTDSRHLNDNATLKNYFEKWRNGEIRAREISNYIIQKLSD